MDRSADARCRVGVVQMTSGDDPAANRVAAARLVGLAADEGAQLIVLPETWNLIAGPAAALAGAEDLTAGPSIAAVRDLARARGVWIVAGSIGERLAGAARIANTSVLIGPDGRTHAEYRKLHLFDVDVAGRSYRESDTAVPGARITVADVLGLRLGMSVCYDLRFPELYRCMLDRGATAFAVPSAFTARTGRDHWEVLLRARAIENQCFVLAADQVGVHPDGSESWGHSMIVGPWGEILAEVRDGEGVAVADLDLSGLAGVRGALPALAHRRADLYGRGAAG